MALEFPYFSPLLMIPEGKYSLQSLVSQCCGSGPGNLLWNSLVLVKPGDVAKPGDAHVADNPAGYFLSVVAVFLERYSGILLFLVT